EIAVARHVAARGGPVVEPAVTPGPFSADGLVVALWKYAEPSPQPLGARETGLALRALHEALNGFDGALPLLDQRLDRAAAVVADPAAVPELGPADRALLEPAFLSLRAQVADRSPPLRVLHGGPHASNLLPTTSGPRWIDLDTVCRGAAEWDLAHLPREAEEAFGEHDGELLELMRGLVGAEVAIWCWHTYGRSPEVDDAARFPLEGVK